MKQPNMLFMTALTELLREEATSVLLLGEPGPAASLYALADKVEDEVVMSIDRLTILARTYADNNSPLLWEDEDGNLFSFAQVVDEVLDAALVLTDVQFAEVYAHGII